MSSMPGAAVLMTSITPLDASRLATRVNPCSRRYSSRASLAAIARTSMPGSEVGEQRLAVELDGEHAPARVGCRARDHSRYRGLPDTPFAGHHHDVGGDQRRQRIGRLIATSNHALRRHLCADY